MFGWKGMGDLKVREGGRRGYSGGNKRWQRKLPPRKAWSVHVAEGKERE
jgi:hypothetical protein